MLLLLTPTREGLTISTCEDIESPSSPYHYPRSDPMPWKLTVGDEMYVPSVQLELWVNNTKIIVRKSLGILD
jgi:hypothetical protein